MHLVITIFILFSSLNNELSSTSEESQLLDLSKDFLKAALHKENTSQYRDELFTLSLTDLANTLDTDAKRIVFWVNIYNAYIQHILQSDPNSYVNKSKFFSKKQIPLFGRITSFDKIEHGFLRRSQWKYGLGNIRSIFRPKYERLLRVKQRDYRIHFALNCGAKSCPPVILLNLSLLESQLAKITTEYLANTTKYDSDSNVAHITPLLCWFRGDFRNKKGIRRLLIKEGLIPQSPKARLNKIPYDWTIDLDNWKLE